MRPCPQTSPNDTMSTCTVPTRKTTTVLVDTSALLALANGRDQYHDRASISAREIVASGTRLVGSALVLAEFHAHLLYRSDARRARQVIDGLLQDRLYEWLDVPLALLQSAVSNWLERFGDQRFSLTDAVSFELMKRHRISLAFAYDRHFEVAGFRLVS
jgi:predicted nucleic acid-binding protein